MEQGWKKVLIFREEYPNFFKSRPNFLVWKSMISLWIPKFHGKVRISQIPYFSRPAWHSAHFFKTYQKVNDLYPRTMESRSCGNQSTSIPLFEIRNLKIKMMCQFMWPLRTWTDPIRELRRPRKSPYLPAVVVAREPICFKTRAQLGGGVCGWKQGLCWGEKLSEKGSVRPGLEINTR